jgi:ribosome-associated protein
MSRHYIFFMVVLVAMIGRVARARRFPTMAFVASPDWKKKAAPIVPVRQSLWLLADNNNNNDNNKKNTPDVEPTWNYVPYGAAKPSNKSSTPPTRRRYFSSMNWIVPKTVDIPEDRLDISFVRSSGSGGQNVNKLSTKVEMRMHVSDANWIPQEVRDRLQQQQANRISKEGYLTLTSQEHRTQGQNRKAAVAKLERMLLEAWPRPKIRKQRSGPTKAAKARNKEFKKQRSATKQSRSKKIDW